MSSWKDVLAKQQDDLERLEQMDRELLTEQSSTTAEADSVLKRNPNFGVSVSRKAGGGADLEIPTPSLDLDLGEALQTAKKSTLSPSRTSTSSARGTRPGSAKGGRSGTARSSREDSLLAPDSPGPPTPVPTAADTAARFAKAKLSLMQKQLTDSEDLRKKLQEQNADLQRSLRNERDEAKKTQKRLALLESEQRREARKTSAGAGGAGSGLDAAALSQEVTALRKEVQTAQRLTKAAETASKNKDVQVRRAQDAVSRMKAQLQELQGKEAGLQGDDRTRADAAEARVKVLERQRADLVSAFKKQMRLVDVLKRQKMHVEAARMLSFTEEEFVKTLDWSL